MNHQSLQHSEPSSDEALVTRVVQRDLEAFTLLYDRYGPAIYATAAHMLGPADAEEIVQEVFLRFWKRAHQFDRERGFFRPWFMTIARYCMLDELRRRNQQQRLIAAADIDQVLLSAPNPIADVEQIVQQRQDSKTVLQALQMLPAEQRQALILAYFGGLSQTSIAKHLNWPLGTVKKRIKLGMQKLRTALVPTQD